MTSTSTRKKKKHKKNKNPKPQNLVKQHNFHKNSKTMYSLKATAQYSWPIWKTNFEKKRTMYQFTCCSKKKAITDCNLILAAKWIPKSYWPFGFGDWFMHFGESLDGPDVLMWTKKLKQFYIWTLFKNENKLKTEIWWWVGRWPVILSHGEGEIGVFWVVGVEVDNYALEVVILSHGAALPRYRC